MPDKVPDKVPDRPRTTPASRAAAPVIRLEKGVEEPARIGRPPKLKMPPLPRDLMEGYTPLEREHFEFFVEAIKQDYGITKPSDYIGLYMAACEYVQLLRINATSAKSGEVLTAARQHPGIQVRAWLDMMGSTRKQRKAAGEDADPETAKWAAAMSKLSAS